MQSCFFSPVAGNPYKEPLSGQKLWPLKKTRLHPGSSGSTAHPDAKAYAIPSRVLYNHVVSWHFQSGRTSSVRKEKFSRMLQRFRDLCRRIFRNKGVRIGFRIFCWLVFAYCLYSLIRFLITLSHTGISFREAIHVLFDIPYKIDGYYMSFEAVALGIVIGLVWFFHRRKRKRIMGKEAESDQSSEVPCAGQKEEWTEPPRSMSR